MSQKNFRYRESVEESFCGFTLYNREYFVFREPIRDAQRGIILAMVKSTQTYLSTQTHPVK